jgi:hypothetical protein
LQSRPKFRGDAEQKLIILTVSKGFLNGAGTMEGDGFWYDPKGAGAGLGKFREIAAESVTQIHHGSDTVLGGQPPAFTQTRGESQMSSALKRTAEFSSDAEEIACASCGAKLQALFWNIAGHGNREE